MDDKLDLNSYTIDELLAEKQKTLDAIRECNDILRPLNQNMASIQAAINLKKTPEVTAAKTTRLTQFAAIANISNKKKIAAEMSQIESDLEKVKEAKAPKVCTYEASVTDHALLRYIERVLDLDVESIRESILSKDTKAALELGAKKITINNVRMIATEGKIITIINEQK